MIINGGSRSNWRFFSKHLTKAEENERVVVTEIRGLAAEDVTEAFREMDALASGTRTKNFFYHANINPRDDETLTPEQWERAIDELEANLGLEGQSRFVVEHQKEGRTHRHVIWSRIDPDTLTAISDSNNYRKHEQTSRALEAAFGLEPVQGVHDRGQDIERPDRRPDNWETFRGAQSGIDPDAVKSELSDLWQRADSGQAFVAALEEHGYLLAKGDKRDFVVIDQAGDSHSLARRIEGAKAKDIRARLADIDRDALPSVAEASARMKERPDDAAPASIEKPTDIPAGGGGELPQTAADKLEREAKDIMTGNGGDLHPLPHAAPAGVAMAEEAAASSPFQRFTVAVKELMRSEEGHMPIHDGLTWWERAAALLAVGAVVSYVAERATEAAMGYWQKFVDRSRSAGNSELDHDHGRDR